MLNIPDNVNRECVLSMLNALRKQNEDFDKLSNSKSVVITSNIKRIFECLKPGKYKSIKGFFLDKYSRLKIKKKVKPISHNNVGIEYDDSDFFCDDRIAVYTAIFGNYESIHEPDIAPNNIDYYIVTDCNIKMESRWKIKKVNFPPGLNAAQKNRYVKMHPHLIFSEYKYSVYVDGSVHILSDLTPLIYRLNEYGFAMHMHSERDDIYDELLVARYTKRVTNDKYVEYMNFLEQQNVPKHYGLVECGVIARIHNGICDDIMEQWWEHYLNGINRDQICLAFVLYKNNITAKEIGTLGPNIYNNYLFKILKHK